MVCPFESIFRAAGGSPQFDQHLLAYTLLWLGLRKQGFCVLNGANTSILNVEIEGVSIGLIAIGEPKMLTDDEQRVQEIEGRVRASGVISMEDFNHLLASRMSWRIIAKQKDKWENMSSEERNKALDKALEDTTADLINAHEEIQALTARVAFYEKTFMRATASTLLN